MIPRFLLFILFFLQSITSLSAQDSKTALILIDIQYFYFNEGRSQLVGPEAASLNAAKLLQKFRDEGDLVVHVRHNARSGAEIHKSVEPIENEKVFSKNKVNAFADTDLNDYLQNNGITRLVICGMMTHMCVEAATRAASDLGYYCVLIHDACATRDLEFEGQVVKAIDVHNATLRTLSGAYAKVIDTSSWLKKH